MEKAKRGKPPAKTKFAVGATSVAATGRHGGLATYVPSVVVMATTGVTYKSPRVVPGPT